MLHLQRSRGIPLQNQIPKKNKKAFQSNDNLPLSCQSFGEIRGSLFGELQVNKFQHIKGVQDWGRWSLFSETAVPGD